MGHTRGQWYASSSSQPGHWYKVDPEACTCECLAGQRGVYCKHLAAAFAARSQPCPHCQHVGDVMIEWARIYDTCHKYVGRCHDRLRPARPSHRPGGHRLILCHRVRRLHLNR